MDTSDATSDTDVREPASPARRWYQPGPTTRRVLRWVLVVAVAALVITAIPYAWVRSAAAGHMLNESDLAGGKGPHLDVVLVLGAQVEPDRDNPRPYLRGRLDTAIQLYRDGNAKVILVSGDGDGTSGNETQVMTRYLVSHGVDPARIVADPYGLDTYDSCRRARDVYGLRRVFVDTQPYHLPRAVTLCRQMGIDATGVGARCDGCDLATLGFNALRDYLASSKAALDVLRGRPPAVTSKPSDAIPQALAAA
jgi:vancomycin permeability regulator SanA